MRVLFVTTSSGSRGGGELYLLFLARALKKEGLEVGLWCSKHEKMDELATSFETVGPVFRSEYTNTYDYRLRSLQHVFKPDTDVLAKSIADFSPDLIHLNKQNTEDGLDLLAGLAVQETPFICTIHITQSQQQLGAVLGKIRDWFSRSKLKKSRCGKWITISESRRKDLQIFLGSDSKIVSIPNAVVVPRLPDQLQRASLRTKMGIQQNEVVVISVGRMELQKDPMLFLEWASFCIKHHDNLKFFWIGDGSLRAEFETEVMSRGLSENIFCKGWQKEVESYYSIADVYIHTARFEGLAFSILEALSWGLPCILTNALKEDISFPEEVIKSELEGLTTLLQDPILRKRTGELSHRFIVEHYSWDKVVQSYMEIYRSID